MIKMNFIWKLSACVALVAATSSAGEWQESCKALPEIKQRVSGHASNDPSIQAAQDLKRLAKPIFSSTQRFNLSVDLSKPLEELVGGIDRVIMRTQELELLCDTMTLAENTFLGTLEGIHAGEFSDRWAERFVAYYNAVNAGLLTLHDYYRINMELAEDAAKEMGSELKRKIGSLHELDREFETKRYFKNAFLVSAEPATIAMLDSLDIDKSSIKDTDTLFKLLDEKIPYVQHDEL